MDFTLGFQVLQLHCHTTQERVTFEPSTETTTKVASAQAAASTPNNGTLYLESKNVTNKQWLSRHLKHDKQKLQWLISDDNYSDF